MTQARRNYVYKVLVALVPILITLGVLNTGLAADVLNLAAAVLAVSGLDQARRNSGVDVQVVKVLNS